MSNRLRTLHLRVAAPVEMVDPLTDPRWRLLAERWGTLFHSPAWLAVLADAYRLEPRAAIVTDPTTETADAGIAWVEVADVRGRRLVSLPFSDLSGPIAVGGVGASGRVGNEVDLLSSVIDARWDRDRPLFLRAVDAAGAPIDQLSLPDRRRWAGSLGLVETGRLGWHWADLGPPEAEGEEQLWSSLASGARQNIRRSRRDGVVVTVRSDADALAAYHRLHRGLRRRKYRLLSQPRSFFDAVAARFGPDRMAVVLATIGPGGGPGGDEAEPVAGVLLLRHRDWGYYKLNASTPEGLSARANDAVMWAAMTQARRWGCRWFDFGVSDLDQPGLIRYKNKYAGGGGEVVVLARPDATASVPSRTASTALPHLTRLFTAERCPEQVGEVAARIGYRWFC